MKTTDAFDEVWPRTPSVDTFLVKLSTSQWYANLAALYLATGRYMPEKAKRNGCYFGFCDGDGLRKAGPEATHVGWTVAEENTEAAT